MATAPLSHLGGNVKTPFTSWGAIIQAGWFCLYGDATMSKQDLLKPAGGRTAG